MISQESGSLRIHPKNSTTFNPPKNATSTFNCLPPSRSQAIPTVRPHLSTSSCRIDIDTSRLQWFCCFLFCSNEVAPSRGVLSPFFMSSPFFSPSHFTFFFFTFSLGATFGDAVAFAAVAFGAAAFAGAFAGAGGGAGGAGADGGGAAEGSGLEGFLRRSRDQSL